MVGLRCPNRWRKSPCRSCAFLLVQVFLQYWIWRIAAAAIVLSTGAPDNVPCCFLVIVVRPRSARSTDSHRNTLLETRIVQSNARATSWITQARVNLTALDHQIDGGTSMATGGGGLARYDSSNRGDWLPLRLPQAPLQPVQERHGGVPPWCQQLLVRQD